MTVSVAQVLAHPARFTPERPAALELHEPRGGRARVVSYGDLDAGARRVAAALSPGERVGLIADNSAEAIAGWFGIFYAGGLAVPIPTGSAPPEAAVRLRHAGCRAVLTDAAGGGLGRAAATGLPCRVLDLATLAGGAGPAVARPVPTLAGDPALILYTSGTTGRARGVVVSHASLLLHTRALVQHTLRLGAGDRVLTALPLSHSYGCRMGLLAPLLAGAEIVLMARFSARESLAAMATHRVTWVPAVPTMLAAWAAADPCAAPEALRWCLSAGAPLADDVRLRAEARLGAPVYQGYGMTEATFATVDAPPDAPTPGSVGRPVWGVEVRVVDATGRDVPTGREGDVLLRGPNQMSGYLDDPEATALTVRDGWVHSGDVGRLDEAGRLWIVDRKRDIILRGGHTLYPSEIEDALVAHPSVVEAAAVGRPHDFYGEEVVAVVVLAPGADLDVAALRAFVGARIAAHKVPAAFASVASLPLGPSRKVLKRTLRAWIADGSVALRS